MAGAIGIVKEMSQGKAEAGSAPIPDPKSPLDLTRRIPELDGMRGAVIANGIISLIVAPLVFLLPGIIVDYKDSRAEAVATPSMGKPPLEE